MNKPNKTISVQLAHQPKSFDWRMREAKKHPWKRVPDEILQDVCALLNQIIQIS